MAGTTERSFERITRADLRRLGEIAAADRESLFRRRPETGRLYRDRLLGVALCQGAALHFVNGTNGVKDFDVWSFYVQHPERPFPYRRNGTADFGHPKFGASPGCEHFVGRRVDLLGRSLRLLGAPEPVSAIRSWLAEARTDSAMYLAQKAVVMIEPSHLIATVVWPTGT